MVDRSSARHTQHAKTPQPVVRKIVHLRWKQRLGPVPIAAKLGMPASTVHAVLIRCRLNRLSHIDRVTGEPARRYERARPGELIHVDVTKFGNIPDGGGWRFVGKQQGDWNRQATRRPNRSTQQVPPTQGRDLLRAHRHRRLLPRRLRRVPRRRERRHRGCGALPGGGLVRRTRRAPSSGCCPTTARAYVSHLWRDTCADLGITLKTTRPRRPQTNGKIERLHRTLADGWAYKKLYNSENTRRAALAGWLHQYNHHRPHSALGGQPPISRLDNLAGHHS